MSTYSSDPFVRPVVIAPYRKRRPATGRWLRVRAVVSEPAYADFFARGEVAVAELRAAS
jgi:hypothetical protein